MQLHNLILVFHILTIISNLHNLILVFHILTIISNLHNLILVFRILTLIVLTIDFKDTNTYNINDYYFTDMLPHHS